MYKKIMIIAGILTLMFNTNVLGQEIKFNDLASSSRGEFTSYISKDGSVYKIGDRIKIGVPSSNKTFAFITEGDGFLLPITPLLVQASGQETEIVSFLGLWFREIILFGIVIVAVFFAGLLWLLRFFRKMLGRGNSEL